MNRTMERDPVKILLVEGNPADADLIRDTIESDGIAERVDFRHVSRLEEALQELRLRRFDAILTDFNLPDATGMPILIELRQQVPGTPIVVVNGTSQDLDLALDALHHGAQDYLYKGDLNSSIHRSLRYAIERKHMAEALTRSESALRERNTLLQAVLDNMADGVVIADREGKLVDFNPAAVRIMGLGVTNAAPDQWSATYGVFAADGVTPATEGKLPLVRAIRGEPSDNVELVVRRPDGSDVYVQTTGRPLYDEAGEVSGGMVVVHNITSHKEAEEALRQKNEELIQAYFDLERSRGQQLALKDQVLCHVSHELRTPLHAASQFLNILRRGLAGELKPEQREYLDDIERNLAQLRMMIGDLLETTRAETGKMAIIPQRLLLQETVADMVRTLQSVAAERGIELRADVPPDLPAVSADPPRVRQILTNLLDNAQKFTPPGGAVTIRARIYEPDPYFVRLSIIDTGRGIDPSNHDRIFTRLAQVDATTEESRKGLGLGLFISKEIVRRHGGEITVESQLGAGAAFHVTLPRYAYAAA
jgi:signal transduction histidine kinase